MCFTFSDLSVCVAVIKVHTTAPLSGVVSERDGAAAFTLF